MHQRKRNEARRGGSRIAENEKGSEGGERAFCFEWERRRGKIDFD